MRQARGNANFLPIPLLPLLSGWQSLSTESQQEGGVKMGEWGMNGSVLQKQVSPSL